MQVQALRSVEKYLNLDALYVLGTNCVDNGPRKGLETFLNAASSDPDTVLHYEFMQVSSLVSPGVLSLQRISWKGTWLEIELCTQVLHSSLCQPAALQRRSLPHANRCAAWIVCSVLKGVDKTWQI